MPSGVRVNDPGKLLLQLAILVGGFALMLTGTVIKDSTAFTAGFGLVTGVAGYSTGNGRLASKGEDPVPMISHNRRDRRVDDDDEASS